MALRWNKEISLASLTGMIKGGGKGGSQGSSGYPSKTTMNLYQTDAQSTDIRKVALVAVLLAACIAAFVKFGVLDQLANLSSKQGELAEQQSLVTSMTEQTADYDAIKVAYDGYVTRYGNASADAIAVLDMVESRVMPVSAVTSIVLSDGTLTLTLYNVPLNTVGDLAKDLENQEMVSTVNVSTATTQSDVGQNTVSTLVVNLVSPSGEEG